MTRGRVAAAAATLAAVAVGGCGGSIGSQTGPRSGALIWMKGPIYGQVSELKPDDRTVGGTLRNDSFRDIDITAAKLRLLDAAGRPVEGAHATFAAAPGHGLWPRGRINRVDEYDQYRIGMKVRLRPGQEAPLTVAWTQKRGSPDPVSVDYGIGTVPLAVAGR